VNRGAVVAVVSVLGCLALALPTGTGAEGKDRTGRRPPPDQGRRAALEEALRRTLADTVAAAPHFPGMLLRVGAPRYGLSWGGAAGLADRATGRPLAPGDEVRIASVTKTFTAATVLRLVEQGHIALDTPIARYLPAAYTTLLAGGGYRPDHITVRHLLRHTGGLADYADTDAFDAAVRAAPSHHWTRLEQVRFALAHGRPVAPPGAVYHYADTGYILLGEIIEWVSGRPLAAAYRSLLRFGPLGLTHTYLETLEPAPPDRPPRAHQYYAGLDLERVDASFDLYGGGGLVSTMADLGHFYRALLRGQVFARPGTLRAMLAIPATNADDADDARRGDGYGMGIYGLTAAGTACWGHDGAWGTFAFHCPALDLTIAASDNQGDVDIDERAFLARIIQLVRDGDGGRSLP